MPFKKVLLIKPSVISGVGFYLNSIPLGLEYIAAYIQNHIERVDMVDLAKDSKSIEYYLGKLKPDLVGISMNYTIHHNESLEIARKAKEFDASVVVGGYHATGLAEELAAHPNIDFVVRGEGEETMLELIRKCSAEEVSGISYSKNGKVTHNPDRPLIKDLDSIPYPARYLRKYKYKAPLYTEGYFDAIMTSRGCWGKCKFCCEPMMCKGIQRYRKPDNIIKELDDIFKLHKNKELMISVFDPNFGGNQKIAEELCDRLIEFKSKNKYEFKIGCSARVDMTGNNEDLVKKMINAGIEIFGLGVESPNEKHLEFMNKNVAMRMTKELQEKAVKYIRNNSGKVLGFFIVGFPYQTEEDIKECINYAKHLEIDLLVISIVTPLPGTELYNELKSKNLIIEKDWDKYDYFNLVFKHEFLTAKRARELVSEACSNIYNDLHLKYEYREAKINNTKRRLYAFILMLAAALNTLRPIIRKEDFLIDWSLQLKELINPDLKRFTKEKGLHNIFEMSRLLKVLGKQEIQIALHIKNKPIVSWIIKTTKDSVEYIDAIGGAINDASMIINIPIEDIANNKNQFDTKKIIKNAFKDNKGIKAKFNLMRCFTAIGLEILDYYIDRVRNFKI